jgi:hypothetical protein
MSLCRIACLLLSGAMALLAAQPSTAGTAAAPANQPELAAELQRKMQAINDQQRQLLERMAEIDVQRRELELMMLKIQDPDAYRAGADTSEAPPADEPTPIAGAEQKEELEKSEAAQPDLPRVNFEVGGVLTPRGNLVLEPSFEYIYSSFNRISIEGFAILPALLVGIIDIRDADRDTYIAALSARYGITSRFEVEVKAPYLWRDDTVGRGRLTGEVGEDVNETLVYSDASGNDFGDVELGLRYQFERRPDWPFLTGNLRVKSTTGTDPFELSGDALLSGEPETYDKLATGSGFWSVNPSITAIFPSDPVVFFGNLGYLYTLEDDKGSYTVGSGESLKQLNYGDVDPGDAIRLNFGMGASLNDRSSFSLSYQLDKFSETRIELAPVPDIQGSDVTVGRLLVGYSLRMGSGAPLNVSVGIGVTDDAPDSALTVRVPFTVYKR